MGEGGVAKAPRLWIVALHFGFAWDFEPAVGHSRLGDSGFGSSGRKILDQTEAAWHNSLGVRASPCCVPSDRLDHGKAVPEMENVFAVTP